MTFPQLPLAYLDKKSGMFWCSVTKIVPVDGKDAVTNTQLSIPCCQASLQQVEDEDAVLIWPPHQLYAQLLLWSAFIQDHMDAVIPQGLVCEAMRRVAQGNIMAVAVTMWVAMCAVAMALFSEDGEPEELAGLFEGRYSVAVGYVADVNAIYLNGHHRSRGNHDLHHLVMTVIISTSSLLFRSGSTGRSIT